jgi:hypothetical protein
MTVGRRNHAAVLLANGDVLIVGGSNGVPKVAEVYNASTGAFQATAGLMVVWRFLPTATLLPSGKVLIVGGVDATPAPAGPASSAELYDPASGKFTATGGMAFARFDHFSILLPNGKVWVGEMAISSIQLPNMRNTILRLGPLSVVGSSQLVRTTFSANLLTSGKVLIIAGSSLFEAVQVASSLILQLGFPCLPTAPVLATPNAALTKVPLGRQQWLQQTLSKN